MRSASELPAICQTQLRWFHRYVRLYVKRNFHAVHLLRLGDLDVVHGRPLLVCLNHPSWWDPLMGLLLSQRFFPDRQHYAPIASEGLAKYRFFERLGFFGVDRDTRSGADRFLRLGTAGLTDDRYALWVTPQGQFADVRDPVALKGGIGHLAAHCQGITILPVALEYAFWNERRPEAFACIGHPLVTGGKHPAHAWSERIASALEETQSMLSSVVCVRDPGAFESLLEGSSGVGGVYDMWRALKARVRGKRFDAQHGRI